MKMCADCGQKRELDQFGKDKSRPDGKQVYCKICNKRRREERKAANPEAVKAYHEAYRSTHREEFKQYQREWTEKNREAERERLRLYALEHPEEVRAAKKKWKEENKEYTKLYDAAYRKTDKGKAVKARVDGRRRAQMRDTDITTEWLTALRVATTHCTMPGCGVELTTDNQYAPTHKELDHVRPMVMGGTHTMTNVRYVCHRCNHTRRKYIEAILDED